MTRLINAEELKNKFWHGDLVPDKEMYHISEIMYAIDNTPTIFSCNACKNMGNERECVDCHDYSNYAHYEENESKEGG